MDDVQTSKKKMPSKKEWRGFYSLILIQAQNAFNEKAAQFLHPANSRESMIKYPFAEKQ